MTGVDVKHPLRIAALDASIERESCRSLATNVERPM